MSFCHGCTNVNSEQIRYSSLKTARNIDLFSGVRIPRQRHRRWIDLGDLEIRRYQAQSINYNSSKSGESRLILVGRPAFGGSVLQIQSVALLPWLQPRFSDQGTLTPHRRAAAKLGSTSTDLQPLALHHGSVSCTSGTLSGRGSFARVCPFWPSGDFWGM